MHSMERNTAKRKETNAAKTAAEDEKMTWPLFASLFVSTT